MPTPPLIDHVAKFILDNRGKDWVMVQMMLFDGPIYKEYPNTQFAAGTTYELGFGDSDTVRTLTTSGYQNRVIDKLTPRLGYVYYNQWGIYPNDVGFRRYQPTGQKNKWKLQRDASDTNRPWRYGADLRWYVDSAGWLDQSDAFWTLNLKYGSTEFKWEVEFEAYNNTGSTQTPVIKFATWMFQARVLGWAGHPPNPMPKAYRRISLDIIGQLGGVN